MAGFEKVSKPNLEGYLLARLPDLPNGYVTRSGD
jgi:hypothetical protein